METRRRIALSISPELDDILTRLSKFNGTTKTKLITALLNDLLPSLALLAKTLEKAQVKQSPDNMKSLQKLVNQAHDWVNDAQLTIEGLERDSDGGN